jgi:hypothetical protein
LKPGEPLNELISYRRISLLPTVSEMFLLKYLLPMVENKGLILKHQFGFGHRHPTIEHTH